MYPCNLEKFRCIRSALHNNIVVDSNVSFLTRDAIHLVLNRSLKKKGLTESGWILENIGCIEIMDGCFIGVNSTIMPNVRIGPRAIVAAGSMATKYIPPGEIGGGIPAKRIGYFDNLFEKRREKSIHMTDVEMPKGQSMTDATAEY